MSKIVIPFYSASGHTRRLAEAILGGVKTITSDACFIDISKLTSKSWHLIADADGIILGAPTFMGGIAGQFKVFLDEFSYRGLWTEQKLVDKLAAGFTVATYPSGDKLNTIMQLAVFSAQCGMLWVNNCGVGRKISKTGHDHNEWGAWLGLMATSIPDKSKLISDIDIKCAEQFGVRFAQSVDRWMKGATK